MQSDVVTEEEGLAEDKCSYENLWRLDYAREEELCVMCNGESVSVCLSCVFVLCVCPVMSCVFVLCLYCTVKPDKLTLLKKIVETDYLEKIK